MDASVSYHIKSTTSAVVTCPLPTCPTCAHDMPCRRSPGSCYILVVASEIVLAIADGIGRQECIWLAGVGEGAVVIVEEHVER